MSKLIPLTRGMKARVSERDFRRFGKFKWYAQSVGEGRFYPARRVGSKIVLLSREIMNAQPEELVDHRDGNTMNNMRRNLRRCSDSQNSFNAAKMKRRGRPDAPRGVCFVPELNRTNPWVAYIGVRRKRIYLGYFSSKRAAGQVRLDAEEKHYGQFSYANSRR